MALGVALAYFPAFAWATGPTMLWEYPEPVRSADVYQGLGAALSLACVALAVGVAALVLDGSRRGSRPTGGGADELAAPRRHRPTPAEAVLVAVGLLALVISWCRSRTITVFAGRRSESGAILFRHWPDVGDGIGMVASIVGALLTVATVVWVLVGADGGAGAARRRAEVWLGATIGLVLDLAVRVLNVGDLTRREVSGGQFGGEPPPVPRVEVVGLGAVVVLLAALALGAAWVAAGRDGRSSGEPADATA